MVFQGENVALTEDVIKKDREFIPTEAESAAKNMRQILLRTDVTSVGTTVLFTVGAKETFFMTDCFLSFFCNGTGAGTTTAGAAIARREGSTVDTLISFATRDDKVIQDSQSRTFNMPVKVDSGQEIIVNVNLAGTRCMGSITGWIEPKRI